MFYDFVIYAEYGDLLNRGDFVLDKRSLDVSMSFRGWGRLNVSDVAVDSSSFRMVAPNDQTERVAFFRRLGAIRGGFVALRLNGGLEFHPEPQGRQRKGG